MRRRHHYEQAFEEYLRSRRIPYVAVDEARKALLPIPSRVQPTGRMTSQGGDLPHGGPQPAPSLKSFDFVIYGQGNNLLVEVKGRRLGHPGGGDATAIGRIGTGRGSGGLRGGHRGGSRGATRLESWVTREDVESLARWEGLFGPEFQAMFVFIYWCDEQPPDALFQEIFEHAGRWYAIRAVRVGDYAPVMKVRSASWGTVDVPRAAFERIASTLVAPLSSGAGLGIELPALDVLSN